MPEHIRQEPKVLVSTENLTEQEWLAYRRQGIGGSDVAAILGISPFRTARDLYDDKLNIASAVDDTGNWVALEMGHLLEPLVAQIFTKKTGLEVFQIKKMFQHPQYPFMLADVDYFVRLPNGEIALLEIKTTNYNAKDHWWKDGEEYVPVYYETQGRHYMAVMDIENVQILSPFREKGEAASEQLNRAIRERVNPFRSAEEEVKIGNRTFRVHDRIMQTKNTEKVSNGDLGFITGIYVGIGTIIQVRHPCRDADFRLTGCHRQTHAAEVTAGRCIRQIVVQIFGDLRNIRCRAVSNFGNSRICCLRRCNLIGRGSGDHRAAHGSCHECRR